MEEKIYRLTSLDAAIEMLRPSAKWEITNHEITVWDDPRPQPTMEEIYAVQKRAKEFENTLDTIWLNDKNYEFHKQQNAVQKHIDIETTTKIK